MPEETNPFVPEPGTGFPDATLSGLRTLGATGMVLAICGLIALPWGVSQFYTGQWTVTRGLIAGASVWMLLATLAGSGLSGLLLAGSVGCWAGKAWARPVMLIFGIASVVMGLMGCFFFVAWFLSARGAGQVRGVSSCYLVVSWPIGTLFGAYTLFYMTRPAARALFTRFRLQPPEVPIQEDP